MMSIERPGGRSTVRLAPIILASMDHAQQALYRVMVEGPRGQDADFPLTAPDGSLLGPFNAFLLSPGVGMALQQVGIAVRMASAITPREREIVILTVASHWNSEFERTTHERIARELGLTEAQLSAIRRGRAPVLDSVREQACAHLSLALVKRGGRITQEEWESWVESVGRDGIFELSTVAGYYATLALQLRIF